MNIADSYQVALTDNLKTGAQLEDLGVFLGDVLDSESRTTGDDVVACNQGLGSHHRL